MMVTVGREDIVKRSGPIFKNKFVNFFVSFIVQLRASSSGEKREKFRTWLGGW